MHLKTEEHFFHDAYLTELTTLRDRLKAGLSGATPEMGTEPETTVSELADRIKALKAAHTIEATPERLGIRQTSAEEPVTSRIRRRTGIRPASNAATDADAAASRAEPSQSPESSGHAIFEDDTLPGTPSRNGSTLRGSFITPATTYQERVAAQKPCKVRQITSY